MDLEGEGCYVILGTMSKFVLEDWEETRQNLIQDICCPDRYSKAGPPDCKYENLQLEHNLMPCIVALHDTVCG